ncbi:MAG: DUF4892 domain-containing protein [Pseudomonadota bacterium]|nr:DUF4892 domain-containing protein [Pseudomonadota bacterium]
MITLGKSVVRLVFLPLALLLSAMGPSAAAEAIFPQAKLVAETSEENRHYLLPLGRVKLDRRLGRDLPAEYKRLDGIFASQVWELSGNQTLAESKAQVQSHIDQARYDLLFSCFSRDCGESFAWANSVFGEAVLYGNDRTQSLWVVKDKGQRRYHVFYLVERPNRRSYFYEETLFVPDLTLDESVIRELLNTQGHLLLGEVPVHDGTPDFGPVLEKLVPHSASIPPRLLVLHRHGDALQQSDLVAQFKQALQSKGLNVEVKDVANLAPRVSAPGNIWVEWVRPDWKP